MTYLSLGMVLLQFGIPYAISRLLTGAFTSERQIHLVSCGAIYALGTTVTACAVMVSLVILFGDRMAQSKLILVAVTPLLVVTIGQNVLTNICQGLGRIDFIGMLQVSPFLILLPATVLQIYCFESFTLTAAIVGYALAFSTVLLALFGALGVGAKCDINIWRDILSEVKKTGAPIYIGALFGVATVQFVAMWAAEFMDSATYGKYSLALAVSSPLGVMISSIGTVIFRTSATRLKLSNELLTGTFAVTLVLAISYLFITQYGLTIIFGEKYRDAVVIAQVLGIGSLMFGVGDVFHRFLGANGFGKSLGLISIASGLTCIVLAATLMPSWPVGGALWSLVASGIVYLGLLIVFYSIIVGQRHLRE
jgi:O-antigen/teichoic acid export membrane protein